MESTTFENDYIDYTDYSSNDNSTVDVDGRVYYRHLNVTASESEYAVPVKGYIVPVFCVITIVVNSLTIVVLSKRHMRSPTNIVLLNIALCDLCTILIPTPWLIYMFTLGNHYKPLYPVAACYLYDIMKTSCTIMFHTASIWLTVLLAIQRYICVCYPLLAKSLVTKSRVIKAILTIYALAAVYDAFRSALTVYTTIEVKWEGQVHKVCMQEIPSWLKEHVKILFTLLYSFGGIFVQLVPCILLILLTFRMTIAMYKAQELRSDMQLNSNSRQSNTEENSNQPNYNSTTAMLIVVIIVFLLVEFPLAVLTVIQIVSSRVYKFADYNIIEIFIIFSNLSTVISFPINFLIYCFMSQKFRDTVIQLFTNVSNI